MQPYLMNVHQLKINPIHSKLLGFSRFFSQNQNQYKKGFVFTAASKNKPLRFPLLNFIHISRYGYIQTRRLV